MRVLLVEDDAMLGDALHMGLTQAGVVVERAIDASAARLALVEHAFSAILLDLGLPNGSGMSVLEALRARYDATPVLIITARGHLSDRLRGLDAGADDYLVKPFPLDELLARLRAVVRRSSGKVVPDMSFRHVKLDAARRTVFSHGAEVALSAHEYRTLLALMERQGSSVSRDVLEHAVYGGQNSIESNTVAVYIHQLRRKLGDDVIATVHGYGYRIGDARA